ncbi:MAG: GldG family protein, partial [Bdellovibrionales bacterium]|nr:GldG family protein [Bdellovibrionales bacterium]
MKRATQFCGFAGLVFIIFGLLSALFISNDRYFFGPIHFVAGILLLGYFVIGGGLQGLRTRAAKRRAGFGAGVVLYGALFAALLALVNFLAYRNEFFRFDSTAEKVYTLAPQTTKVLDNLDRKVLMRGFFLGGQEPTEVLDLVKRMTRYSRQLEWQSIDPEREPGLVEQLGINEPGTIHFSFADGEATRSVKVSRDVDEQEIVNALLKLTRGGKRLVYYVTGHGEPDLESQEQQGFLFLKESIEGENIEIRPLVLGETKQIPDDANAIILAAPEKPLLEVERRAIAHYLAAGGHAVLLNEPRKAQDIADLVRPLQIEVGKDVIIDQVVTLFGGPSHGVQPMISLYGKHAITQGFNQGMVLSIASSVRPEPNLPADDPATRTVLAYTSENSWAESDVEKIFGEEPQAALEDTDIAGPVPVAVAYEGPVPGPVAAETNSEAAKDTTEQAEATDATADESTEEAPSESADSDAERAKARVVVIGDSSFVANSDLRQLYNRDFFLNSLNWVLGEEQRVSIRARSLRASAKPITAEEFGIMFLVTALLFPECVLLFGLAAW